MLQQADDNDESDDALNSHLPEGPLDGWPNLQYHARGDEEVAEMVRYEYMMNTVREWELCAKERLAQEKVVRKVESDMNLVVRKRKKADNMDGEKVL